MADNNPKTNISHVQPGQIRIKGYDIAELMGNKSFAEIVYLVLRGELPNESEAKIMDAILSCSVDHGATSTTALAARNVVSGGNPLNAAVAGGILTIGDSHGGAIEQCARILQGWATKEDDANKIASDLLNNLGKQNIRMPGFGHLIHKSDPRSVRLFELADNLKVSGKHQKLAQVIETQFADSGKSLPINIDGAIAAVISDMGFDWRLGKGFFIISRTVGLIAQAYEEQVREKPLRSIGKSDYEYDGPNPRKL